MKLIPCSIMLNDVARPISAPKGITVALTPSKVSSNKLPPLSNSILPAPVPSPSITVSYTHLTLPTN